MTQEELYDTGEAHAVVDANQEQAWQRRAHLGAELTAKLMSSVIPVASTMPVEEGKEILSRAVGCASWVAEEIMKRWGLV